MRNLKLLELLLTVSVAVPAAAQVAPTETDARKIMEAVEGQKEGDKTKGRLKMTITDRSGRSRERVVLSRGMLFDGGRRQLMHFESPADVRNTGLLSIDYDDGAKDDDQWLYLPSLHKSTRISSGDKSGSFMGTDLSYSDMTSQDPAHWDYSIVEQSVQVGGEDCWLIEARPKTDKAKKETGYLKTHMWVSKAKLMPLQIKAWVKAGKKLKYIKFEELKSINGVWVPHKISAQTKRGDNVESTTVLQFSDVTHDNADVTDADFSQRNLEKGI